MKLTKEARKQNISTIRSRYPKSTAGMTDAQIEAKRCQEMASLMERQLGRKLAKGTEFEMVNIAPYLKPEENVN